MSIGIKIKHSKPPSEVRDKCERDWHKGGGLGWQPGTTKKFEGMGINRVSKQYQENYDKIDWSKK